MESNHSDEAKAILIGVFRDYKRTPIERLLHAGYVLSVPRF